MATGDIWVWNNDETSLLIISASGAFTGLFEYSPAPGAGNLVASLAATGGTDPFGNPYRKGITVYNPAAGNQFVNMVDGQILFGNSSSVSPGSLIDQGSGSAAWTTSTFGAGDAAGLAILNSKNSSSDGVFAEFELLETRLHVFRSAIAEAIGLRQVGDAFNRYQVDTGGRTHWGPGTGATDTVLYRSAANTLKTDDSLAVGMDLTVASSKAGGQVAVIQNTHSAPADAALLLIAQAAGDETLGLQVTGDSFNRFESDSAGKLSWGPGSGARDVNLYRGAANQLKTDDAFDCEGGTAANPTLITTDTWHSLGTLANYTVQVARYRLTPENEIEIDIEVTSAGANAQSTTFSVTPPAQYRPLVDRHSPLASTRALVAGDAANRLFVAAAGGIAVVQQATSTGSLGATVRIPLD